MKKIAAAIFVTALLPLAAGATERLLPPSITYKYSGECRRNDKTENANLSLTFGLGNALSGALNKKPIQKAEWEAASRRLMFDAPDVFQGSNIIRHFAGQMTQDFGDLTGELSQDDGKFAKCKFSYTGSSN